MIHEEQVAYSNTLPKSYLKFHTSCAKNDEENVIESNIKVTLEEFDTFSSEIETVSIYTSFFNLPIDELLKSADKQYELSQFDNALIIYHVILHKDPNNINALIGIGNILHSESNPNSIPSAYNKVLEIDDRNANSLIGIANVYAEQITHLKNTGSPAEIINNYAAKALSLYEQAYCTNDLVSQINALNGLANIYVIMENYDAAFEIFDASIKQSSKNENPQLIVSLNGMAAAKFKAEQITDAISYYKQVEKIDPYNFHMLVGLLTFHTLSNNIHTITEYEEKLKEYEKQASDILTNQGKWLLDHDQIEEAQRLFEKAHDLDPRNDRAIQFLEKSVLVNID